MTQHVEAQNLREVDHMVSIQGHVFESAAEIAHLDFSERGQGWVWLTVRWHDDDINEHFNRTYRLGIYEEVTVA